MCRWFAGIFLRQLSWKSKMEIKRRSFYEHPIITPFIHFRSNCPIIWLFSQCALNAQNALHKHVCHSFAFGWPVNLNSKWCVLAGRLHNSKRHKRTSSLFTSILYQFIPHDVQQTSHSKWQYINAFIWLYYVVCCVLYLCM